MRPRLLITAGPTFEPIDAVRYIGNRSSGRMGLALAGAAIARQWPTTLLLGPAAFPPPQSSLLAVERFQTAADLQRLLAGQWPRHDVLLMAAAVADFTPVQVNLEKMSRGQQPVTLNLKPTPDLVASLAATTRRNQVVVGFALEPASRLPAAALEKLARKRLDAIVANPLETMEAETVTATLLLADGSQRHTPERLPKAAFAEWLLDNLHELIAAKMGLATTS